MATMADITIKKNDGTTDITYSAKVASAGDNTSAVWKSTTVGTAPAHNPTIAMSTRSNGPNTARRVDVKFVYPHTVTGTDGSVSIDNQAIFTGSFVLPQGMPQADINEAVSQCYNLLYASLIKTASKDGYAPV